MMNLPLASANPLEHVVDVPRVVLFDGAMTVLSNHVIMMLLAALLLILLMPRLVRLPESDDEVERLTPRGPRNAVEGVCQFLREFVARPNLGPYTDRFIPYIWTAFFFILTINLLGLLPLEPITKPLMILLHLEAADGAYHGVYGTATANVWVTGTLACCTLFMIVFNGLRLHGMSYVKHFFMGPFPISLLIAFLEVVGLVAKTFALAVRLFANMLAGHTLLAVLVGFIAMTEKAGKAIVSGVTLSVVLGSVAINMLELFVAFLQAFIFTFLSCVFIGQAVNLHHEHEEDHGQGEEAVEGH